MNSKEEKLSLLSEMIEFAKVDETIKEREFDFIMAVALQIGVSGDEVNTLVEQRVEKVTLRSESQRILQFHRLVLLMNIDQEIPESEIQGIRAIGLHMGIRREAIDTILKEMHKYPNKVIPPEELIAIFTRFYN